MKHFLEDKGTEFGKWDDPISKFMYFDVMPQFLKGIKTKGKVADFGGANGNLKQFIPNSISIDIDATKKPDIVDNILLHRRKNAYDLIVIRYVLHYLSDLELDTLMHTLRNYYFNIPILIIQFANDGDDLIIKKRNSRNEKKHFRTTAKLFEKLTDWDFRIKRVDKVEIEVTPEFYVNRLGGELAMYEPHLESIYSILLK